MECDLLNSQGSTPNLLVSCGTAGSGAEARRRYDRVIHLDCDSLVMGSLTPLLRLDLAAKPLWTPVRAEPLGRTLAAQRPRWAP